MKNFLVVFISILCSLTVLVGLTSIINKKDDFIVVAMANEPPTDESPPKELCKCYDKNNCKDSTNNYISKMYEKSLDIPVYFICRLIPLPKIKEKKGKKKRNKNKSKKKR